MEKVAIVFQQTGRSLRSAGHLKKVQPGTEADVRYKG